MLKKIHKLILQLFIVLVLLSFLSCQGRSNSQAENFDSNNQLPSLDSVSHGLDDCSDKATILINEIEHSNSFGAESARQSFHELDTLFGVYTNGFECQEDAGFCDAYSIFRYNEFIRASNLDDLKVQLIRLSNADSQHSKLVKLEYDFVRLRLGLMDSLEYNQFNLELDVAKLTLVNSNRIRYIKGYFNLYFGNLQKGLLSLDSLLSENYYSLIIYDNIISRLSFDSVLRSVYIRKFQKMFPKECAIFGSTFKEMSESYFPNIGLNCFECFDRKKSRFARMMNARDILERKDFVRLQELITVFFAANSEFINDYEWLYERGWYYDLSLQMLFAQGNYKDFVDYILDDVGVNEYVDLKNEEKIKKYVFQLFQKWIRESQSNFESFYQKHIFKYMERRSDMI